MPNRDIVLPESLVLKLLEWMQVVTDCYPMDYYPSEDGHRADVERVNELREVLHLDPWQPEMG